MVSRGRQHDIGRGARLMSAALSIVRQIAEELQLDRGAGWFHRDAGPVAGPDDVDRLTRFLYRHYFMGLGAGEAVNRPAGSLLRIQDSEDPTLVRQLSAARPDATYWSPGWRVTGTEGSLSIVTRAGVSVLAADGEWQREATDAPDVCLRLPTERRYASPGFYTAFSAQGPALPSQPLVRLYCNVDAATAPALLAALLAYAADRALALTVKVANHSDAFARRDTTVAYLDKRAFDAVKAALVAAATETGVREGLPAFVAPLARGVGWADDPHSHGLGQVSFGMHRCRALALGLAAGATGGGANRRYDQLIEGWRAAGIDPDTPHLCR